jgi:tRNA-Thr(GGU) m(6)t(6)A37 methyltransferase TsaA
MELKPIGIIHSPFTRGEGTPIQPRFAQGVEGIIEIFTEYGEGLKDLDGFERIWVLYWMHKSAPPRLLVKPYMDDSERGLFATRAPSRPNPIGISCVRLLRVDGVNLHIGKLDMLDRTPVLDIKPYAPQFDCFEVERIGWLAHADERRPKADGRFHDGRKHIL